MVDFPDQPSEIPQQLLGKKVAVEHAFLDEVSGSLELRAYPFPIPSAFWVGVFACFAFFLNADHERSRGVNQGDPAFPIGLFFVALLFIPGSVFFALAVNWRHAREKVRLRAKDDRLELQVFGLSWEVPKSDLHAITEVKGRMRSRGRYQSVRQIGILWRMQNGDYRMEPVITLRMARRHDSLAEDLAGRIGVALMRPQSTFDRLNQELARKMES